MRRKRVHIPAVNRKGMALVLTLLAISFMMAVTVQLFSSVNWQMQASANVRDSVRLDAMNRSGLSLIRAALRADKNKYDSPHDDWGSLDAEKFSGFFGADQLTVSVTDLSGRIQVNALVSNDKNKQNAQKQEKLQYALWIRFLRDGNFAIEDDEVEALIDSLIDWIDKDDNVRGKGAESGYYLSQSPPYKPRNGPVLYLEELLLIQGMTKDLFYGNEEHPGISDYLTVSGDGGKININTAPPPVLLALDEGMTEEMVQDIIEYREDEENEENLANVGWFKAVGTVSGDVDPDTALLSVQSDFFKVTSRARINDISREGTGILQRKENGEELLYWEVR